MKFQVADEEYCYISSDLHDSSDSCPHAKYSSTYSEMYCSEYKNVMGHQIKLKLVDHYGVLHGYWQTERCNQCKTDHPLGRLATMEDK